MNYKTYPHQNIAARIATTSSIPKNKTGKDKVSAKQKAKDSMQPCDELAAVFGVCKKPSISRSKL